MDTRTLNCKQKYEGKEYFTSDGKEKFVITKFNSGSDVRILFPDVPGGLEMRKSVYQLNQGIPNPFPNNSPVYFSDPYKKYINTCYMTNEGFIIKVIDYKGTSNVTVQFQDEFGYVVTTTMQNIKKGQVKNPYIKNKFGGYLGESIYVDNPKEYEWLYRRWYNMLIRGTNNDYYLQYHGSNTVSYENTTIDPIWLNYSNFAAWYMEQIKGLNPNYDYEVDKDLLYRFYANETGGKKCYGPRYCVVIPHDLNSKLQLTNVKKGFKSGDNGSYQMGVINASSEIKQAAEYYYKNNAISQQVYNVIING